MNKEEARAIIRQIKYKKMEFDVDRSPYGFFGYGPDEEDSLYFRMKMQVTDIYTGRPSPLQTGVHLSLYAFDTEEKILEFVYRKCVEFETHEAGEWFCYKGKQPFNPHANDPGHNPDRPLVVYDQAPEPMHRPYFVDEIARMYSSQDQPQSLPRESALHEYGHTSKHVRRFLEPTERIVPPPMFDYSKLEESLIAQMIYGKFNGVKLPTDEVTVKFADPVKPKSVEHPESLTISKLKQMKRAFYGK